MTIGVNGEKAIIYDFATQYIPSHVYIDYNKLNLEQYIKNIIIIYNKHKSTPVINLVNECIKKMNLNPLE